jgi:hypothetical protein
MSDEERLLAARKTDPRSPVERYNTLTRKERTAFNAFFRGALGNIQICWDAKTESILPISFGKAECEWVPIGFWKYKLPGLRLATWTESDPKVALGLATGSVFTHANITITPDGHAAYADYMKRTAHHENKD